MPNTIIDSNATLPPFQQWSDVPGPWKSLPNFPAGRQVPSRSGRPRDAASLGVMLQALRAVPTVSTNLIGRRRSKQEGQG